MDGVSVAASIIGISAAGSQIAIKLYTLATQIGTASDRISSISNDVFSTAAVLQQLGELMNTSTHDGTTIFNQGGLDTTRASAAMCETIFKDIEQATKEASEQLRGKNRFTGGKIKLSRSEKLKWPFLQPSIDTLRKDLGEAKAFPTSLPLPEDLLNRHYSHHNTSKNIVEQREIIDAILALQKEQNANHVKPQRLPASPTDEDKSKMVTSRDANEISVAAATESAIGPSQSSNPANTLPIRPNVLIAMPPSNMPEKRTARPEPASGPDNRCLPTDYHASNRHGCQEDGTPSDSGHSSLRGGGVPTPTESTLGSEANKTSTLIFLLMKPIIKDLGDVVQLSWQVHDILMRQAEILSQISKDEKEGLPSVYSVYQSLAGFDVSLRSLKRVYIDMTHREMLFKGIPGLQVVLERSVQNPLFQARPALAPGKEVSLKNLLMKNLLNDKSTGSWAEETDDIPATPHPFPSAKTESPEADDKSGEMKRRFPGGILQKATQPEPREARRDLPAIPTPARPDSLKIQKPSISGTADFSGLDDLLANTPSYRSGYGAKSLSFGGSQETRKTPPPGITRTREDKHLSAVSNLSNPYVPSFASNQSIGEGQASSAPSISPNPDDTIRMVEKPRKPQCFDHGCNGREFSTFSDLLRHQREKLGTTSQSPVTYKSSPTKSTKTRADEPAKKMTVVVHKTAKDYHVLPRTKEQQPLPSNKPQRTLRRKNKKGLSLKESTAGNDNKNPDQKRPGFQTDPEKSYAPAMKRRAVG
ncbi:MAG: hypothetical protein Q9168_005791 [Polycauliona sp. 1 TL-2023]